MKIFTKLNNIVSLWIFIIAACAFNASNSALAAEPVETVSAPKLDGKIKMDGFQREDVWKKAAAFSMNEALKGDLPPGCGAGVKIWRDDQALYLGFRCENPYFPLFLKATERSRDAAVYSDECVEIFIDTGAGKPSTRQIIVNAVGSAYDGDFDSGPNSGWNGEWTCAASIVRGAWYAEVRIPFSDLGDVKSITINCCRGGFGKDGLKWNSAWKAPGYFKPAFRINLGDDQ